MKLRYGFYYTIKHRKQPFIYEGTREYTSVYGVFRDFTGGVERIDVEDFAKFVREYNP